VETDIFKLREQQWQAALDGLFHLRPPMKHHHFNQFTVAHADGLGKWRPALTIPSLKEKNGIFFFFFFS